MGARGASAQHTPAYRRLCRCLRRWREEAGLTQRALAERLDKPHSYVWKVEMGERRIDPVEFVSWCRGCGVKPVYAIREID